MSDRPPLRIAIRGSRPEFARRARWVLGIMAEAVGRSAVFAGADPDLVYSPTDPGDGRPWIPLQAEAQAFFSGPKASSSGDEAFPGAAVHRAAGLTLLFAPVRAAGPFPGDVVASAFYLLARWDELRVAERDEFGRLPLAASAFGRMAGLELEEPAVEGYIAALRSALGHPEPTGWDVALTHDIDRIRRRTARSVAGMARRGDWRTPLSLALADPWDNLPELLKTSTRRGTAPTVFFIGRNRHRLDGTPRRAYERERRWMAEAVLAAGGEVGLHGSFAASEDGVALAAELAGLRAEVGPVAGVRFHYLRFRYHDTVRWLEAAGADYDGSLGFSEAPGFACGIARPFRPWLVGEERPANLTLLPLAVMDTALHSRLGLDADAARERALRVLDAVRRAGGRAALLWHNTYLADERAPGYGRLWEDLLDELRARGARLGPAGARPEPNPSRLDGRRVLHLTSVHRPNDIRIFHKQVRALGQAGADARVLGLRERPANRLARLAAGWRLIGHARATGADVFHVHDPELLAPALWLARRFGRPVIYDVHEYLGRTARTKPWLPAPTRVPIALAAERAERWLAARLSGVVAVNADLAARFAAAGTPATTVDNAPWADEFPAPTPLPAEPRIVYVGGLGVHRGLELMRGAFGLVGVEGAVLRLVGAGDPGEFPHRVEAIGLVPPEEIPAHLIWARVAWIPIQASHGNAGQPVIPTKLIEAMAAGRPVVVSDIGRMAQVVNEAGCGIVVAPGDGPAHAAALRTLLTDPVAAEMGRRGREAFETGLGFEHQAARLTEFYARVLARR